MKSYYLLIPIAAALYITSCSEEESIQQGHVQFSFSSAATDDSNGRKPTSDIPAGSFLRISVAKENGDTVFTSKKIALIKTGDDFFTDPVILPQGRYVINDFTIVSAHDSLLFAIPKRGSDLAKWVKNPLTIPFTVGHNDVSNVQGEVVSAERRRPEEFGYSAFGVAVATIPGFSLAAFTNDGGNVNPTTAHCAILHGIDTVFQKSLTNAVNEIDWNVDAQLSYTLVITKDGYGKYQQQITSASLGTDPLTVVLQPALTVTWKVANANIYLDGQAGAKLSIDWGDNTVEKPILQNTGYSHTYAANGSYFVSITGDLDAITFFEIEYQDGVNHVSPIHLPGLTDFRLPLCEYTSDKIDFSGNPQLKNIDLSGLRGNLRNVDISNNTALLNLDLQADNLPSSVMDALIDAMYQSCVNGNLKNGYVNINTILFNNPYSPSNRDLIGPPSAAQVEKLNKLVSDYGWFVFPISTMTSSDGAGRLATNAGHERERLMGKFEFLRRYEEHNH